MLKSPVVLLERALSDSRVVGAGREADERIITLDGVGVRQARVLTSRPRLRRKRKAGERERRERQINDIRCCFHGFYFLLLFLFCGVTVQW